MQRFYIFLFIILQAYLLTACSPVYKRSYAYVPPKATMGKVCVNQCIQNQTMCEQMCQMRIDQCKANAHQDALYQYESYKQAQMRSGQPIHKTLADFNDSFQCRSISCDCKASFNGCYSACGGQVRESLTCVAFCGKN